MATQCASRLVVSKPIDPDETEQIPETIGTESTCCIDYCVFTKLFPGSWPWASPAFYLFFIGMILFFIFGGIDIDYGRKHNSSESECLESLTIAEQLCNVDTCMRFNLNGTCGVFNSLMKLGSQYEIKCENACRQGDKCTPFASLRCHEDCIQSWSRYSHACEGLDGQMRYTRGAVFISMGFVCLIITCICNDLRTKSLKKKSENVDDNRQKRRNQYKRDLKKYHTFIGSKEDKERDVPNVVPSFELTV